MFESLFYMFQLPDSCYRRKIYDNVRKADLKLRRLALKKDLYVQNYVESLKKQPIAVETQKANEQHYEFPTRFFDLVLGPYKKYSGCYWKEGVTDLGQAEKDMLDLYIERLDIQGGQYLLDLGCGWGSFSLYVAKLFPNVQVLSISNSQSQMDYINGEAQKRNLTNIKTKKVNINHFSFKEEGPFDRIISIEMLEHMRNYEKLFKQLASCLKDDGLFFAHIFSHREVPEIVDEGWMAQEFFSGGQYPSHDLFSFFDDDLVIEKSWKVNGTHYEKTARAWLENLDKNKIQVKEFLKTQGLGKKEMIKWRLFFIACEVFFAYNNGEDWQVSHYLFKKKV